jgi:hypothetical protein
MPRVVIQAEAPTGMQVNGSDSISVALLHTSKPTKVKLFANGNGRQASTITSPYPVGTPGAAIGSAFGLGYQAYASSELDATQFDVQPTGPRWQSLEEKELTWNWDISAKSEGPQVVNVGIDVEWLPLPNHPNSSKVERRVWDARFPIAVELPLITAGQFNAAQILGNAFTISSLTAVLAGIWKTVLHPLIMWTRSKRR